MFFCTGNEARPGGLALQVPSARYSGKFSAPAFAIHARPTIARVFLVRSPGSSNRFGTKRPAGAGSRKKQQRVHPSARRLASPTAGDLQFRLRGGALYRAHVRRRAERDPYTQTPRSPRGASHEGDFFRGGSKRSGPS